MNLAENNPTKEGVMTVFISILLGIKSLSEVKIWVWVGILIFC
jgi:hypothetical protein